MDWRVPFWRLFRRWLVTDRLLELAHEKGHANGFLLVPLQQVPTCCAIQARLVRVTYGVYTRYV